MNVFVTGATGALGRPTVTRLLADGHAVRALAHGDRSAERLRRAGVEPVRGSLFDPAPLADAMRGADAVLHLATRIPPLRSARRRAVWAENDRIRAEGTRNLVDAALRTGVGTVVYPSFALVYADGGARWVEAGDPVEPTEILASTLAAEDEMARFTRSGSRGVVLRVAGLYGPHSAATEDILAMGRRGISPFLGSRDAYSPLVWDEDAADALVAAVEVPDLVGTFDVADDEPMTRGDLASALAAAVGRPRLRSVPTALVRPALGRRFAFALRSQRVSNRRFQERTGWAPRVRSAADGLARLTGTTTTSAPASAA